MWRGELDCDLLRLLPAPTPGLVGRSRVAAGPRVRRVCGCARSPPRWPVAAWQVVCAVTPVATKPRLLRCRRARRPRWTPRPSGCSSRHRRTAGRSRYELRRHDSSRRSRSVQAGRTRARAKQFLCLLNFARCRHIGRLADGLSRSAAPRDSLVEHAFYSSADCWVKVDK